MAKRKKYSRKNKAINSPQHKLPVGFWAQVGALILFAVAILLVIAWFGSGGPILDWFYTASLQSIGYAVYIVPAIFIYVAIEIFRSEQNRLPHITKVGVVLAIVWFSALFGLLSTNNGKTGGGYVGDLVNSGMTALVSSSVAAFIYVLLIIITLLFILRVSLKTVFKKIWQMIRRNSPEMDANAKVMRSAAILEGEGEFKLNASVPTVETSEKGIRGNLLKGRDKSEDQSALVTVSDPNWKFPSLDLLEKKQSPADAGDYQQNARIIQNTLAEFDIEVKMEGANIGPRVTQFTLLPAKGVRLDKISSLEKNLALALGADSIRIEAPIPGQKAVGIEVPNIKGADVRLYSMISNPKWKNNLRPLTFAIGRDIAGDVIIDDLGDMPHLLIAGQTKAGKSVMINTLITSLVYHNSPSDLKLILVDPKRVEMTAFEDIPHLLTPIITEPEKTISALKWCVHEMERRYVLLSENKVRNIKDYNEMIKKRGHTIAVKDEDGIEQQHENGAMPYIVIVVDEMSDLKQAAPKDFEGLIIRLAQKGRAAGLHLVIATQSPRKDVITGLIKANVPAKIAFSVSNQMESRIILDHNGAEKLLGNGDMLLSTTSMSRLKRVQGAWVTDEEVHKVMDFLRMQSPPQYNDDVVSQPVHLNGHGGVVMDFDGSNEDDLYNDAVQVVIDSGKASASLLQRRLRIGYSRAARIIEDMENQGIVGPPDGARPRDVLISSMDELAGPPDEF